MTNTETKYPSMITEQIRLTQFNIHAFQDIIIITCKGDSYWVHRSTNEHLLNNVHMRAIISSSNTHVTKREDDGVSDKVCTIKCEDGTKTIARYFHRGYYVPHGVLSTNSNLIYCGRTYSLIETQSHGVPLTNVLTNDVAPIYFINQSGSTMYQLSPCDSLDRKYCIVDVKESKAIKTKLIQPRHSGVIEEKPTELSARPTWAEIQTIMELYRKYCQTKFESPFIRIDKIIRYEQEYSQPFFLDTILRCLEEHELYCIEGIEQYFQKHRELNLIGPQHREPILSTIRIMIDKYFDEPRMTIIPIMMDLSIF